MESRRERVQRRDKSVAVSGSKPSLDKFEWEMRAWGVHVSRAWGSSGADRGDKWLPYESVEYVRILRDPWERELWKRPGFQKSCRLRVQFIVARALKWHWPVSGRNMRTSGSFLFSWACPSHLPRASQGQVPCVLCLWTLCPLKIAVVWMRE